MRKPWIVQQNQLLIIKNYQVLIIIYYIDEESKKGEAEVKIKNTGKKDPKRHLGMKVDDLMHNNIGSILARMIATKTF